MRRSVKEVRKAIAEHSARSAWDKGCRDYALDLFDEFIDWRKVADGNVEMPKVAEKDLLNGATSWEQYSYGGCAEVYDGDICERLCSPSMIKKYRGGERNPSANESWLDVQAKALRQAARLVRRMANQEVRV